MLSKIKILILFVLVSIGAYAQQDSLYFTSTHYIIPGQGTGSTISLTDTIYNQGTTPFVGTVTLAAKVINVSADTLLSSQFSADSLTASDTLFTSPTNNYKALNITINGDTAQPFAIGPNTIVIWPIIKTNGTLMPDNRFDTIYINTTYYPLGIKESPLAHMYIFETPGLLNIHFGDAENLVQQVRIINILGQDMYSGSPENSKNIPTAGWSMGIYLCEITTMSGDKRTFKFRLE